MTISEGMVPFVLGGIAVLVLAFIVFRLMGVADRRRGGAPRAEALLPWESRLLPELRFAGPGLSSSGPLQRGVTNRLVRSQSEDAVGLVTITANTVGPYVKSVHHCARNQRGKDRADGERLLDVTVSGAPRLRQLTVEASGRQLGTLVNGGSVVASDGGRQIGEWQTGGKLGVSEWNEADKPVYGILVLPGEARGKLRVPFARSHGQQADFIDEPFLTDVSGDVAGETQTWLLAFLALSSATSAILLGWPRRK